MEENCLINAVVYKCDVTRPLPKEVCLGLAEGEWKEPFLEPQAITETEEIFQ